MTAYRIVRRRRIRRWIHRHGGQIFLAIAAVIVVAVYWFAGAVTSNG